MITILGPTACGKTTLAVALAKRIGGEILSADSRQVYRRMDIGTGKDLSEYDGVPYHLIDICEPGTKYNLFQYLQDFGKAYRLVTERGAVPILCGGTGLYFSALLRGLDRKWTLPPPAYPVLQLDRAVLHARIAARLDEMFMQGLAAEVVALRRRYPVWSDTASAAIGYKEFIDGEDAVRVRERILARTRQLAKRQQTWFRHQATPQYVPVGETVAETAENVWRTWREHGPWQVCLPEEGDK